MATWQAILIILGALVIGSVLGIVTIRLISRSRLSQDNYYQADRKNHVASISKKSIPPELTSKTPLINSTEDKLELMLQERIKSMPSIQPAPNDNSGLLAELMHNLSIATKQPNGKLLLFQTNCWDKDHNVSETSLNNYREELTQAYTDIHLANMLVSLSNDLGHTSLDLEQSYLQLCTKIAARLKMVISYRIPDK